MRLSLREAFDLTQTCELKLGATTYRVPPLTFGRFQELLRVDHAVVGGAIEGFSAVGLGSSDEEIGRRLAYFPVESFLPLAKVVIPGLVDEHWKEATPFDVFGLFVHFGNLHDWAFIADAIHFGKPREENEEEPPTATQFAGILLTLAEALHCQMPEILNLRIEGFFMSVEAIKQRADDRREAEARDQRDASHAEMEQALPVMRVPKGTPSPLDAVIAAATPPEAQGG